MTTSEKTAVDQPTLTGERADLLESLHRHRYFLRYTVRDLTDEQAAARPTVSALCLGGLIRHVAETEASWIRFAPDELVATARDLDESHPLPAAPWFEPGARWSLRRVLLHIIAETAQHAGHADIIRETLDGAK